MARKKPETLFSAALRKDLRKLGFKSYKRWGGLAFSITGDRIQGASPGMPDLEVVGHGRRFDVETKAPTGGLSSIQKARIAELRQYGGTVFVVKNSNREHFMELMRSWAEHPIQVADKPDWSW